MDSTTTNNNLVIDVQNLHCYICSLTFDSAQSFKSHRHNDSDSTHEQQEDDLQAFGIKAESEEIDNSNGEEEKEEALCSEIPNGICKEEKKPHLPLRKKRIKYKSSFSTDKKSSNKKKKRHKLVNFFHCPNCYETFDRLQSLKAHFVTCDNKVTETFDEFQLRRIQQRIWNKNNSSTSKNLNKSASYNKSTFSRSLPAPSNICDNDTTINGTITDQYFNFEVRCNKCEIDFLAFANLIEHLNSVHLKLNNLKLNSSSAKRTQGKKRKIETIKSLNDKTLSTPDDAEYSDNFPPNDDGFDSENDPGWSPSHDEDNKAEKQGEGKNRRRKREITDENNTKEELKLKRRRRRKKVGSDVADDSSNSENTKNNKDEVPILCPTCGKTLKSKSTYNVHVLTHTEREKKVPCSEPTCDKMFRTNVDMYRHRYCHGEPIICSVFGCGKTFIYKRNMVQHLKVSHPSVARDRQAQSQGEEGEVSDMIPPTEECLKPFKCEYPGCDRRFSRKGDLKVHTCIHTGEKQWTCSFENCGKSFNRNSSLRKHERAHRGERNFLCFQCGRAFRDNCSLQSHVNLHNGVKPHRCTHPGCDKAYAGARALSAHMETHADKREYKCEHCPAAFNFLNVLKKHLQVHNKPDRPFKCALCNSAFSVEANLKSHVKRKHVEKSELCTALEKITNEGDFGVVEGDCDYDGYEGDVAGFGEFGEEEEEVS